MYELFWSWKKVYFILIFRFGIIVHFYTNTQNLPISVKICGFYTDEAVMQGNKCKVWKTFAKHSCSKTNTFVLV